MCGNGIVVKASKSGRLCYTCPPPADGGCGHQTFARYDDSERKIASDVVTRWRKPEYRAAYLGGEGRAPAPKTRPSEPAPDRSDDDDNAKAWRDLHGDS